MKPEPTTRSRYRTALLSGILSVVLHTAAVAQEPRHYVNARFGFSADIPAGFVPRDPPENGDGLQFDSRGGGALLTVSAIRNVEEGTMASFMAMSSEDCPNHRPSYLDIHRDWAVLSCRMPDGRVLYERSALRGPAGDGVFTTVRMTYPFAERSRWDAQAVAVARSMKPAPGG